MPPGQEHSVVPLEERPEYIDPLTAVLAHYPQLADLARRAAAAHNKAQSVLPLNHGHGPWDAEMAAYVGMARGLEEMEARYLRMCGDADKKVDEGLGVPVRPDGGFPVT